MKNFYIILFQFLTLITFNTAQSKNQKYELWQSPSFFRGYNVLYGNGKTIQDFIDLKSSGATLAQIACYGFMNAETPFDINQQSISGTDSLVNFCRQVGIYYTIAVRKGPGREDVYEEGIKAVPHSTIWKDIYVQSLYGYMLKDIVNRYKDDSLFVGIGLIVEPNPLPDSLYWTSSMLKNMLDNNKIYLHQIMKQLIDSVRSADPLIPILVQNVAFSCPEYFDLMKKQTDSFVVYEFHSWRPNQYVYDATANHLTYPGKYWAVNPLGNFLYNKTFLQDTTFKAIRDFQETTGSPIFLGEFGMRNKQNGGIQLLQDISDIALDYGWHFSLWDWRNGTSAFNFESYGTDYWDEVKLMFSKNINSTNELPQQKYDIRIYPLVAQNSITVTIKNNLPGKLYIYNVMGIEVLGIISYNTNFNNKYNTYSTDISTLSNGIYFVSFTNKDTRIIKPFLVYR